jgi:hypothetical protein
MVFSSFIGKKMEDPNFLLLFERTVCWLRYTIFFLSPWAGLGKILQHIN